MSLVTLNPSTLADLRSLIDNPASALPAALTALQPGGRWDLLTQKVSSDLARAGILCLAAFLYSDPMEAAPSSNEYWV